MIVLQSGIHHPKTVALAKRLGIPKAHAVGILEMLWHATAEYAPRGDIGKIDDEQIAACIEWSGDPLALIAALLAVRYLDKDDTYRLIVHDWHKHCPVFVKTKRAVMEGGFIGPASPMQPTCIPDAAPMQASRIRPASPLPTQPNPAQPSHATPRPTQPNPDALPRDPGPLADSIGSIARALRVESGDPGGSSGSGSGSVRVNGSSRSIHARKDDLARRVGDMIDQPKRLLECLRFIDGLDGDGVAKAEGDIIAALKAQSPGGIIVARWLKPRPSRKPP